jgi:D-glycerate 3-kinase
MQKDIINYTQGLLLEHIGRKFTKIYIEKYILPIITNIINSKKKKFLISGSQGVGKSTLVLILKSVIENIYNKKVMSVSLDDYYFSKKKRLQLSKKIHPLLRTRGVPGTHDTDKLRRHINKFSKKNFPIIIPIFDKLSDDITKRKNTIKKADILLLEGWCCGCLPIDNKYLCKNINKLESDLDKNYIWRNFYNDKLQNDYKKIFKLFDLKIYMQPASFKYVHKWRSDQEKKYLSKSVNKKYMSKRQLDIFIQHYEKVTKWMIKTMPAEADMLIKVNKNQMVDKIIYS